MSFRAPRTNFNKGRGRDPAPTQEFLGGDLFGELTFVEEVASKIYEKVDGRRFVRRGRFACTCGNETIAELRNVRRGFTTSCGCVERALRVQRQWSARP